LHQSLASRAAALLPSNEQSFRVVVSAERVLRRVAGDDEDEDDPQDFS
jgi:hypothetical protein